MTLIQPGGAPAPRTDRDKAEHARAPSWYAAVLLSFAVLAACGDGPGGQAEGEGAGGPAAPVSFVVVERQEAVIHRDYVARLHGAREAEVRARVGGILEARLYDEGSSVAKGTSLFRLDRAPYRIALQRSEAELANARAALNQAEREWRRVSGLFEQAAVSERERDQALSTRELAEARVALAEAGVAQAGLDLEYATVSAPVAGVTGLEAVTEGNLISRGGLLTTVTQLDPVQARFAMPAEDAVGRRSLASDPGDTNLEVRLLLEEGGRHPQAGRIDFVSSKVDEASGSVMMRAIFPNPELALKPGALARVRLAVKRFRDAYVVPPEAVSQGMAGAVIFVIDAQDQARSRDVRLGPEVEDGRLVLEGLEDGDRVVVEGQVGLRDGMAVEAEQIDSQGG
ncbi:efflux RND transporter periplasmic adaptor subunit [Wenzhouxiangella sp. XN24]|uniref:efflux RND transporter periplasmic adaptor subunit n=1 Tax=Wenzhouxiangella sp. XN24 TaxID=2713569 RepID=UPI00197CC47B